jgi:hypothetical protein
MPSAVDFVQTGRTYFLGCSSCQDAAWESNHDLWIPISSTVAVAEQAASLPPPISIAATVFNIHRSSFELSSTSHISDSSFFNITLSLSYFTRSQLTTLRAARTLGPTGMTTPP